MSGIRLYILYLHPELFTHLFVYKILVYKHTSAGKITKQNRKLCLLPTTNFYIKKRKC